MTPQELEGLVIGGLLINGASPDSLEVIATLPGEAFSIDFYRKAYIEIKKQALTLGLIDGALISETMGDGSSAQLSETMKLPTASNLKGYAALVGRAWFSRKAVGLFQGTADKIRQARNQQQRDEIVDSALAQLVELTTDQGNIIPVHISDLLTGYTDLLEKRFAGDANILNLMTGIEPLDQLLGGIDPTDLVVLAGRPGMGKTELLVSIVEGATRNGGGALIFSMEMSALQIVERSVAGAGRLSVSQLRDPKQNFGDEEWARVSAAMGILNERDIWIIDASDMTVEQICALSETHKRRHPNLAMIAVDYLGLIIKPKAERNDIAISMISGGLKRLAGRISTPVFALSQLSRKVEERPANSRRPINSDLRDSGSIEQDAARVIMLYRDVIYNPESPAKNLAELIVTKNRHGEIGTIYQEFKGGHFLPVDQITAEQTAKVFQEAKQREKKYATHAF
jgi:replicative DNA helicase